MKHKLSDFFQLYFSFFVYSLAAVFSKIASQQKTINITFVYLMIEFVFLAGYALIWQQVLKKFPLVVAMSNKGITVIFALFWSVLLFHERITMFNVIGAMLVIIGMGLVSAND